ncbi:Putative 115 kDa protein in type-1 retrotransposable element R1DM-like Protein [Tribolium castaneum]|uniref:115 kDa protein in type-1 retrotransposable element R1DM-like Protein n=1 Tax=Tribolium castaneum TaxID=7070 RepID=D7EL82_TRICA|nr:Putative 115 kDa protein in type-1 retrotransposable element R1DM-like Protein [Tribolium castaneum]
MAEVVNSIVMYAAPIWGPTALDILKYQERLVQVQRKTALRVCSAYRTVSADAVQVIAGMIPIDLRIHETVKVRNRTHTKREAREWSIKEWQNRWNASSKGRWTHRLIPNIRQWIERKKNAGQVNFYLTQFLSGHGDFRCYLKKMHRAENDRCVYCGEMDTAEHVLFQCGKWAGIRHRLEQLVNEKINPDNLVEIMLRSNKNWRKVQRCTEDILKFKMEDEKTGQINSPRDSPEVLTSI